MKRRQSGSRSNQLPHKFQLRITTVHEIIYGRTYGIVGEYPLSFERKTPM